MRDRTSDATQTVYQNGQSTISMTQSVSGATTLEAGLPITGSKVLFHIQAESAQSKPIRLEPVDFIRDPFGNSYGYSTANPGKSEQQRLQSHI